MILSPLRTSWCVPSLARLCAQLGGNRAKSNDLFGQERIVPVSIGPGHIPQTTESIDFQPQNASLKNAPFAGTSGVHGLPRNPRTIPKIPSAIVKGPKK